MLWKALLLVVGLLSVSSAHAAEWPSLSTTPAAQGGGENDAALVVGIEKYALVAPVPGAAQNAKDWWLYLRKGRGVPLSSIQLLTDAEGTVEKLRDYAEQTAAKVKPGGTLWFVFVGHGAAAKDGKDGLLVGFDAQQDPRSLYARSVGQAELRAAFEKSKAARVVMLVDSCFSGQTGTGAPLAPGVQPLIPLALRQASGKVLAMTAGRADEFAGPLPGADRPAFSYLVLGALRGWGDRNADGKVTAQEAVEYAQEVLGALVKGRSQTPQVFGDQAAVLAIDAKEQGPDLDAIVMGGFAPAVPVANEAVEVPRASEATGGVFGGLNLEAERLHDAANRVQADPSAPGSAKALAWCALAGLQGENPYRQKAANACEKWRAFDAAERQKLAAFEKDLAVLEGFLELDRPKAEKLAKVDLLLKVYGDLSDTRIAAMRERRSRIERGKEAQVRVEPEHGLEFVKIPGGTFSMGCVAGDTRCNSDEKPARSVTVGGFQLGKTEVTVAAYAKCVEAGACGIPDTGGFCNWGTKHPEHPINCVDWEQASAFCQWIGGRLPSAEEWEYAAKGGKARIYPWGNQMPNAALAKFFSDGTAPVGSHRAGATRWGLLDMAGNVSEWTATNYDANTKELRGGGFSYNPPELRVSNRLKNPPSDHYPTMGFRCAQ